MPDQCGDKPAACRVLQDSLITANSRKRLNAIASIWIFRHILAILRIKLPVVAATARTNVPAYPAMSAIGGNGWLIHSFVPPVFNAMRRAYGLAQATTYAEIRGGDLSYAFPVTHGPSSKDFNAVIYGIALDVF